MSKKNFSLLAAVFCLLLMVVIASAGPADKKMKLCIYDPAGAHGDIYNMAKDYGLQALEWGVDFEMKPFTDEKIAAEDFKANQCDAVVLTGFRGRAFNQFTGSIDSIGSIPSYEHMRIVIKALANPKLAPRMNNGPYEVAGIVPMGAGYLFVNDRKINTVDALTGKKIAVLEYDKAQERLVSQVGASAVSSDLSSYASKFNNGSVDICAAPVAAYSAMELYKGMEPRGGVVRYALGQMSLQLIIRQELFPEGFGQKSRDYYFAQFDRALSLINASAAEVDKKWWIEIPEKDKLHYAEMMRQARISLRDDGIYHASMMTLLRKVRCKINPTHGECTEKVE